MRILLVDLIVTSAPPAPRCFDSDEAWQEWLVAAHVSGERVVRRVDTGKHIGQRQTHFEVLPTGRIDHCGDCTPARRFAMVAAGRCMPSAAAIESGAVPVVNLDPLPEAA